MAMNPVIKFTTLFGLLAVELAVQLTEKGYGTVTRILAGVFFAISTVFVYRSFYGMRIGAAVAHNASAAAAAPSRQHG